MMLGKAKPNKTANAISSTSLRDELGETETLREQQFKTAHQGESRNSAFEHRRGSQEPLKLLTSHISARKEVLALAEWVADRIKRIPQGDDDKYFEQAIGVYSKGVQAFGDMLSAGCKEQGQVLSGIWTEYQKLTEARVGVLRKRTEDKENELNKLSCSLLGKFEAKFRECGQEIGKLKGVNRKLEQENSIFKEMMHNFEHDVDTLYKRCVDLTKTNEKLTKDLAEMGRNSASLKTILFKSTANDNKGTLYLAEV